MNIRDIEHMWKVASNNPNHDTNWHDPVVIRFADLVASAERERILDICKEGLWDAEGIRYHLDIRARGQA